MDRATKSVSAQDREDLRGDGQRRQPRLRRSAADPHRRSERRRGALSAERVAMLDRLHILWEPAEAKWQEAYEQAKALHASTGRLEPDNDYLKDWISRQHSPRKAGKLTPDLSDALDKIGMQSRRVEKRKGTLRIRTRPSSTYSSARMPSHFISTAHRSPSPGGVVPAWAIIGW
ncbi:helicase associated domain-containing protein [Nonomuraea sp. NPDC003727]